MFGSAVVLRRKFWFIYWRFYDYVNLMVNYLKCLYVNYSYNACQVYDIAEVSFATSH